MIRNRLLAYRQFVLSIVLALTATMGLAQSPERAFTSMQKKRWTKAKDQLDKALQKDSLDAAAYYVYARFYFTPENPAWQIDSAYRFAMTSRDILNKSTQRQADRLRRFPLDTLILNQLRQAIDSAAFERAKTIDSEESFLFFLEQFPLALQRTEAIQLRDEAAYRHALGINSYQSFQRFIEKYPNAAKAGEARFRYEKLLYQSKTSDKKLSSYTRFLQENPATPYRNEIDRHIFELSTINGKPSAFLNFIQQHPSSSQHAKGRNMLFHLLLEQETPQWPTSFLNDSLQHSIIIQQSYLVPVFEHGKFGFMDQEGRVMIQPVFNTIKETYLCGNIQDDILSVEDKLVARTGKIIYAGGILESEDLGHGFLKIKTAECAKVIHKSGFVVMDCVEDAQLLDGRYITAMKENHWALFSLTGRELSGYEWQEITAKNNVIIFKKDSTFRLISADAFAGIAEGREIALSPLYEEVKIWPDNKLWVRSGQKQAVLDQSLNAIIPMDDHQLSNISIGVKASSGNGTQIYLKSGGVISVRNVRVNEPWVVIESDSSWRIFSPELNATDAVSYDSVHFAGPFLVGLKADSLTVNFDPKIHVRFVQPAELKFIPGKESENFLLVRQQQKNTLYNQLGRKLFTTEFEELQYVGAGFFIVTRKDKKGLLDPQGKLILPTEYDAIGTIGTNMLSLLKNNRFGAYNTKMKKTIKPQFHKNITSYNRNVLSAFEKGYYGFITWESKRISKFEFQEIKYWNDSTALVKLNSGWQLYDLDSKTTNGENIKRLKFIKDSNEDKIVIVQLGKVSGVISSRTGEIIPATFTDIVNMGSVDEPLFFTEKHVEEAAIYVVIYYNKEGKMIRRQVFEEADYERIYCSDN